MCVLQAGPALKVLVDRHVTAQKEAWDVVARLGLHASLLTTYQVTTYQRRPDFGIYTFMCGQFEIQITSLKVATMLSTTTIRSTNRSEPQVGHAQPKPGNTGSGLAYVHHAANLKAIYVCIKLYNTAWMCEL